MGNLFRLVSEAIEEGQRVALATVVRVEGSTPREVGARMVVYSDGRIAGTVGGGRMEALTIEEAIEAIRQGKPRMTHFDLVDAEGSDPGICGGQVDVFIDAVLPRPILLIAGAGHVAVPVAEIGYLCGFQVVVVDDRPEMVSEERFPHASKRMSGDIVESLRSFSIDPSTSIVIVTRGHAHDEEALRAVIGSSAAYIGMIGSRRKVRVVLERLRADGIDEGLLGRVRSPIGLNIGAQTPAEIAVSIMAEVIMLRYGKDGQPMKIEP